MDERYIIIYGRHAVLEALQHRPDVVAAVWLREDVREEVLAAVDVKVPNLTMWAGKKLPVTLPEGATHQGVIAKLDRQKFLLDYNTFMSELSLTPDDSFVILGELQDPHNVGAVIRNAAAFGLSGVLVPKHRQASITGTVVKVSAGMVFKVPIVEVGNVNRAIEDFKRAGAFVYGLAGEGAIDLSQEQFTKPSVFVLGSEGEGLREKTREHCDTLLRIPMHPRTESLNVAASAATVFYAWSSQHPGALQ
jgi:23S rRNA (guanosine2251-2'-O)-methyltransferase